MTTGNHLRRGWWITVIDYETNPNPSQQRKKKKKHKKITSRLSYILKSQNYKKNIEDFFHGELFGGGVSGPKMRLYNNFFFFFEISLMEFCGDKQLEFFCIPLWKVET